MTDTEAVNVLIVNGLAAALALVAGLLLSNRRKLPLWRLILDRAFAVLLAKAVLGQFLEVGPKTPDTWFMWSLASKVAYFAGYFVGIFSWIILTVCLGVLLRKIAIGVVARTTKSVRVSGVGR